MMDTVNKPRPGTVRLMIKTRAIEMELHQVAAQNGTQEVKLSNCEMAAQDMGHLGKKGVSEC